MGRYIQHEGEQIYEEILGGKDTGEKKKVTSKETMNKTI